MGLWCEYIATGLAFVLLTPALAQSRSQVEYSKLKLDMPCMGILDDVQQSDGYLKTFIGIDKKLDEVRRTFAPDSTSMFINRLGRSALLVEFQGNSAKANDYDPDDLRAEFDERASDLQKRDSTRNLRYSAEVLPGGYVSGIATIQNTGLAYTELTLTMPTCLFKVTGVGSTSISIMEADTRKFAGAILNEAKKKGYTGFSGSKLAAISGPNRDKSDSGPLGTLLGLVFLVWYLRGTFKKRTGANEQIPNKNVPDSATIRRLAIALENSKFLVLLARKHAQVTKDNRYLGANIELAGEYSNHSITSAWEYQELKKLTLENRKFEDEAQKMSGVEVLRTLKSYELSYSEAFGLCFSAIAFISNELGGHPVVAETADKFLVELKIQGISISEVLVKLSERKRSSSTGDVDWALKRLELAPGSYDLATIESQFKKLAKKHHPDTLGPDASVDARRQSHIAMSEINEAAMILKKTLAKAA